MLDTSKSVKKTIIAIIAFSLFGLVFVGGYFLGTKNSQTQFQKAEASETFLDEEKEYLNSIGENQVKQPPQKPHGLVGIIQRKELIKQNNLVLFLKTKGQRRIKVLLNSQTKVDRFGEKIGKEDLNIDETIAVIGKPDPRKEDIIMARIVSVREQRELPKNREPLPMNKPRQPEPDSE